MICSEDCDQVLFSNQNMMRLPMNTLCIAAPALICPRPIQAGSKGRIANWQTLIIIIYLWCWSCRVVPPLPKTLTRVFQKADPSSDPSDPKAELQTGKLLSSSMILLVILIMQGVMIISWLSTGYIEILKYWSGNQVDLEADPKDSRKNRKLTICENLCHVMKE